MGLLPTFAAETLAADRNQRASHRELVSTGFVARPLKRGVGFWNEVKLQTWKHSALRIWNKWRYQTWYVFYVISHGAFVFLILAATSGSILAQEMKDRELRPAFDFTMIQMPVEIVSIRLNGKDVRPGEKIKGNDDWLQSLCFILKNISDKAIAYVDVGLRFPRLQGLVVYSLNYGVDLSRGLRRGESSPPAIQPGETLDLVLTKERYQVFLNILAQGGASSSFDTAPYYIERVCFENEPDVIWEGGNLKRRDPNQIGRFNVIERYVCPSS